MLKISNNSNWFLHDNGIDVVTDHGERVVDLRNECIVESIFRHQDVFSVIMRKSSDDTQSDYLKIGNAFNLTVTGVTNDAIPVLDSEQVRFEGLYDFADTSVNLCIGDECYLLKGSKIHIDSSIS